MEGLFQFGAGEWPIEGTPEQIPRRPGFRVGERVVAIGSEGEDPPVDFSQKGDTGADSLPVGYPKGIEGVGGVWCSPPDCYRGPVEFVVDRADGRDCRERVALVASSTLTPTTRDSASKRSSIFSESKKLPNGAPRLVYPM